MPLPSSRDKVILQDGLQRYLSEQLNSNVEFDTFEVPEAAGYSSETYLFDARWKEGSGRFVARMGPTEADMPVFASYDLSLQVNSMGLVRRTTDLPVPFVRWFETDPSYVGSEFYIMDRVSGQSAPDNPPYVFGSWVTEASPAERRVIQNHCADVMAKLHAIELTDSDVAFLSRPEHGSTPLTQHLDHQRWYYDWAREGVDYPTIEAALDWLEKNKPTADPLGFNWGDSRIGNIMFDGGEVTAIVDWEMACLGAPAADVAWQLMLHHFFLDIIDVMGMPNPVPDLFKIPDYVGRYEETAGKKVEDLEWYYIFNHLRFATIAMRTTMRMVATGEREPAEDPEEMLSNKRILLASMAGTNKYWDA